MDYETFPTRSDAEKRIEQMAGWPDAKPEQLYLHGDANADADGNVWVIVADGGRYLRQDGYLR